MSPVFTAARGMALTCVPGRDGIVAIIRRSTRGYASGQQLMSLFNEEWKHPLRPDPEVMFGDHRHGARPAIAQPVSPIRY